MKIYYNDKYENIIDTIKGVNEELNIYGQALEFVYEFGIEEDHDWIRKMDRRYIEFTLKKKIYKELKE
jgi:hypothetical protein